MAERGQFILLDINSGLYVEAYDPDWLPKPRPEPIVMTGLADWTPNEDEAIGFDDAQDAFDFWKQQSKVLPVRPDGELNRPLTAHTVEVRKVGGYDDL